MNKIKSIFSKLTPYHHFLVFLIILTVLKIVNVFITKGDEEGIHYTLLGIGLIVISTVFHFTFSYFFDKRKKYLHSLISTFLILLMLSHADPEPVRGILVILLLYVAKFFIKYKGQNIFNPVVFTIGITTLLALFVPFLNVPPMDFSGIDIRFPILGMNLPLTILPITLALLFNVKRVQRHPLAISFIVSSLVMGYFIGAYDNDYYSYLIVTMFVGAAVIVEPKTSPNQMKHQMIYGVSIAIIISSLSYFTVPNSVVIGLLIGYLIYFSSNQKKHS